MQLGGIRLPRTPTIQSAGIPDEAGMGNPLVRIIIGTMVFARRDLFTGIKSLFVILVIPLTQIIALVGRPAWLALNSRHGYSVTWPAAGVTFLLSLLIAYLVCTKVCRERHQPLQVGASAGT
jgi:hypothetical protein